MSDIRDKVREIIRKYTCLKCDNGHICEELCDDMELATGQIVELIKDCKRDCIHDNWIAQKEKQLAEKDKRIAELEEEKESRREK